MRQSGTSGVAVRPRTRTEVLTRIGFIGRFVREIVLDLMGKGALLFGLDHIVDRGIVEEQEVAIVLVEYLKGDKLIGRVSIEIDYERHRVNCRQLGDTVTVDLDQTSTDQVSRAIARLVAFFQRFRAATGAQGRLLYCFRPEVGDHGRRSRLGSATAESLDWLDGNAAWRDGLDTPAGVNQVDYSVELRPQKLDEVTIRARHIDPRLIKKGVPRGQ